MPTVTSGGQALTRARLERALAGLPVTVSFTARFSPWCWTLVHVLDRRRAFHPWNQWSSAQFAAARDPDMESAAVRLAAAGYHVTVRPHPDPVELAALPEGLRDRLAGEVPVEQPYLVPD